MNNKIETVYITVFDENENKEVEIKAIDNSSSLYVNENAIFNLNVEYGNNKDIDKKALLETALQALKIDIDKRTKKANKAFKKVTALDETVYNGIKDKVWSEMKKGGIDDANHQISKVMMARQINGLETFVLPNKSFWKTHNDVVLKRNTIKYHNIKMYLELMEL